MVWLRSGDKPLSEPMMASLLKHICITRPQWFKNYSVTLPLNNGCALKRKCRLFDEIVGTASTSGRQDDISISLSTNLVPSAVPYDSIQHFIQFKEFVRPYQEKNTTQYRGYCIDILEILATTLNFR